MTAPLPEFVGRYAIRGFIGRGGMGALYLAWDPKLERDVALKVLREGVDSEEMLLRFTREARSAARLRHPHIVTIFDVGEQDDKPYIAMEYVTGQTLAEIIKASEPLSIARKIELLEELCAGLGYAHRQGIVHRDIKPANLMLDSEGLLKILDFGIARVSESMMTQTGVLIGTLNYMSPEQVAGSTVDARSDIFAVGAVAYELFTYRMAFPGNLQTGILHKILHTEPEPLRSLCPWLDQDVVRIIEKALGKQPEARYQDLKTMRTDLVRARQNLAEQAAGSTAIPPPDPVKKARAVSTPAHSRELKEIERRRQSQIESWLDQAARLIEAEDFAGAVTAIENALLLDATDERALSLYSDARGRLGAQQAQLLASEAEEQLERGALTLAEELAQKAVNLSPKSSAAARAQAAVTAERQKRDDERRVRESIDAGLQEGSRLLDEADYEGALAALQKVLGQAPDHHEAAALIQSAQEGIAARQRRQNLSRARDTVTAARAEFAAGRHESALAALRAFEPPHELVTATLDELARQHAALLERARVRQEQLDRGARALSEGDTEGAERAIRAAEAAGADADDIRPLRAEITRLRDEAARRAARERAEQERQAAVAAAIARADRATDPDDQIVALREVLRLSPDHVEGRRRLDEAQRAVEQRAAAVREQERRHAAARGLLDRAAKTASHADAVALLREAILTDPTLVEAAAALAGREQALEIEAAQRRERERRRDESRRLLDRAARTDRHAEAIGILREALALDSQSADIKARLSEREAALQAEEAAAAERERRRKDARRLVGKAAKTPDHAAAISLLRDAVALDPSEAQPALAERERLHAAEIAAQKKQQEDDRKRREEEKKREAQEAARRAEALAAAERKRLAEEAALRAEAAAAAEKKRRDQEAARQAERAAAAAEKKRADEEAARRAVAEAKRKRQEEEAARQAAIAAAAEKKRREEVEAARRAAAEAERKRLEAEAAAAKKRQEEEAARRAAEEKAKRQKEAAAREAAAAAERQRQEADRQRQEADRQRQEAERRSREAVAQSPAALPAAEPAAIVPNRVVSAGAQPISPAVKRMAAAAVGVLVIVAAVVVWRSNSAEPEMELLPIPSIPSTVAPTTVAPVAIAPPGTQTAPAVTTSVPAVTGSTTPAEVAARAEALRRQAAPLLPSQPAQALPLLVEALRLQPDDRASRQLLNRVAVVARNLASQAQARASARTANPTYRQADQANQFADSRFKQGDFEAAARSWLDARTGFERAAAEPPQVASATSSIPVQLPPPATTTVAPVPATTTVPVPVTTPSSLPVSPPTSVAPATTTIAAAPSRNDQALILNLLSQYAAAYSRLDLDGVLAVYPGLDVAATRKAFSGFRALQMTIENAQVSVSGETASVSCTVRQVFTPRAGRGSEARTPTRFDLARQGDRWVITARR